MLGILRFDGERLKNQRLMASCTQNSALLYYNLNYSQLVWNIFFLGISPNFSPLAYREICSR